MAQKAEGLEVIDAYLQQLAAQSNAGRPDISIEEISEGALISAGYLHSSWREPDTRARVGATNTISSLRYNGQILSVTGGQEVVSFDVISVIRRDIGTEVASYPVTVTRRAASASRIGPDVEEARGEGYNSIIFFPHVAMADVRAHIESIVQQHAPVKPF